MTVLNPVRQGEKGNQGEKGERGLPGEVTAAELAAGLAPKASKAELAAIEGILNAKASKVELGAAEALLGAKASKAELEAAVALLPSFGTGPSAAALAVNPAVVLQAAVNTSIATGFPLRLPAGTFDLGGATIYINATGVAAGVAINGFRMAGSGRYRTILKNGILSFGRRNVESPNDKNELGEVQISNAIVAEHFTFEGTIEVYGCQRSSYLLGVTAQQLKLIYSNTFSWFDTRMESGAVGLELLTSHDCHFWGGAIAGAAVAVKVNRRQVGDARMLNVVWHGTHFEGNASLGTINSVGAGGMDACIFVSTEGALKLGTEEVANDVRGFTISQPAVSAKVSGTGAWLVAERVVGLSVCADNEGRITGVEKGIEINGAKASKVTIGYPVFDTVTEPVIGYTQPYTRLWQSSTRLTNAAVGAVNYIVANGQTEALNLNINSAAAANLIPILINPADVHAGAGTAKMRMSLVPVTGAGIPAVTLVAKLCPYTIAAGVITPGAAVGEVEVVVNAANAEVPVLSADFALPAAGNYAVFLTLSGAPASAILAQLSLDQHSVN